MRKMARPKQTRVSEKEVLMAVGPDYRNQLLRLPGVACVEKVAGGYEFTREIQDGKYAHVFFTPVSRDRIGVFVKGVGITPGRIINEMRREIGGRVTADVVNGNYETRFMEPGVSDFMVVPSDFMQNLDRLSGYIQDANAVGTGYRYLHCFGNPASYNHHARRRVNVDIARKIDSEKDPSRFVGHFCAKAEHEGDDELARDNFIQRMNADIVSPERYEELLKMARRTAS